MTQKILALETSETAGSVALLEWDTAMSVCFFDHEERLDPKSRSAQSLAPLLDQMLHQANWTASDLTTIGISIGPGSFTGLRVGLATAKAIGYVTHAKLVTVDTRDAIAEAFFTVSSDSIEPSRELSTDTLVVWVDAQRGQVVTAVYQAVTSVRPEASSVQTSESAANAPQNHASEGMGGLYGQRCGWRRIAVTDHPISMDDAVAEIARLSQNSAIWLSGSILNRPMVRFKVPQNVRLVPESMRSPTARAVATITARKVVTEDYADLWNVQPFYSRPSAAEERRTQQKTNS